MILKNYLLFILKKQLLIKFNFLNIYNNIIINNIYLILPYYLYKLKLNINIIYFFKILLNIFSQRIFLNEIIFKNVFKVKFILLKFILNIKKYNFYYFLDYLFLFLYYNYNYFTKKVKNIIIFNNKLLIIHYNLHNFYKKFSKYDCIIIYKIIITLNFYCKNIYNSYYFNNLIFF